MFGPTASLRHLPPNQRSVVIEKKMDCAPCYNGRFCKVLTHACMKDITLDEMVRAVEELI